MRLESKTERWTSKKNDKKKLVWDSRGRRDCDQYAFCYTADGAWRGHWPE